MENKDLKYDILIGNLRRQEPGLVNPEELTSHIMSSLHKGKRNTTAGIIIRMRPWLSAAAVFLIALFIYQNADVSAPDTSEKSVTSSNAIKSEPDRCLAGLRNGKINRETLLRSFECYQRQSERKSSTTEQLMMKYQHKL